MTPQDLKDGIRLRLAELWPDRTVYPDVCPDDHDRPSSYVQVVESTPTQVNAHLVRWDVSILIILWGEQDHYALADSGTLMADQKAVISALFPLLAVEDRVVQLHIADKGQDAADGAAFVEAKCQWFDGIDSLQDSGGSGTAGPTLPIMNNFHGKIRNEEGVKENG